MVGDVEIIKLSRTGTIKLPSFIDINQGEKVYFRKDFYDDEKFMILDHENLCKIGKLLDEVYKSKRLINLIEYNKINRFIFPAIIDLTCKKGRLVRFPFKSDIKQFSCEEVHTSAKIKKFILTPIKEK